MWYATKSSKPRIAYADSTDGLNWKNHQHVLNPGSEGTYDTDWTDSPSIIKDGLIYKNGILDGIYLTTASSMLTPHHKRMSRRKKPSFHSLF